MAYDKLANTATPSLIIYLLDTSESMGDFMTPELRKIDVVADALYKSIQRMVHRAARGPRIAPRYRMAMFTYNDELTDAFDGEILTIDKVAAFGKPTFEVGGRTNSWQAFEAAEKLLRAELGRIQHCPPPLVCHMTDGMFTGSDPTPIAQRIMNLSVPDGNVLLLNIFIASDVLTETITDPKGWPGVTPATRFASNINGQYAAKLRDISSPVPEGYRQTMAEFGYRIDPNALMMLPGTSPDLVSMAFQMASATKISR